MKRNKTFKKARKAKGKWSLPFLKKKEETAVVVYKEPSKPSTKVLKRKPKSSKAIEVRLPNQRTTISEEPTWTISSYKKPSNNKMKSSSGYKTKDATSKKASLIQRLLVGGKSKSGSPSYSYDSYSYGLKDKKRKKTSGDIAFQKYLKKDREKKIAERKRQEELQRLARKQELIEARRDVLRASKEMRKERIEAARVHPGVYVASRAAITGSRIADRAAARGEHITGKIVGGIMTGISGKTAKKPKKRKTTTWW